MSLQLIIDVTNPEQDGLLDNFLSEGKGIEQDFVRGDKMLAFVHQPVKPSIVPLVRPWDADWLETDTFQVAVGNKDTPPTSGSWPLGIRAGTITTSSVANPTVITTSGNHNLVTGDTVLIAGHVGSTPDINGTYSATVTGATTFTIPVNVTVGGTGGYVYDGEGMESLSYAILAASLTTTLSALSVKHGYPALTATLLATGSYQALWATNAAVPQLYSPASNNLTPDGTVTILTDEDGDASTQAQQIIILRQSPIAFAEPTTPLPDADIVATVTRSGDATHNKLYALTMTDGVYGGSFSVTVTAVTGGAEGLGVVSGTISAQDFANLLATQSEIESTDNVSVTRVGNVLNVEFIGTQGLSNTPVIAVTNVDLLAPMGVSGTINFNTVSLYRAFLATTASELEYTFSIRRMRATGEEAEYFQHTVTLKRSLLDAATLVPVDLPSYYTQAQTDALLDDKFGITTTAGVIQGSEFGVDFQASDTYVVALSPPIPSYVTGARYRFKANTANTGAATVNFDSCGAKAIVKLEGGIATALEDNDIRAGQWVEVVYDGTNMQMISEIGRGTSGTGVTVRRTGPTIDAGIITLKVTTISAASGAITIASGIVSLTYAGVGAYTIAAPSSQDGTRITITANSDNAHVVTFTGGTLLDGTTGANTTATFAAFKGASITVWASGATWLVESLNQVTCAP